MDHRGCKSLPCDKFSLTYNNNNNNNNKVLDDVNENQEYQVEVKTDKKQIKKGYSLVQEKVKTYAKVF